MNSDSIISSLSQSLSTPSEAEVKMRLTTSSTMPSLDALKELMMLLRRVFFPGFFDDIRTCTPNRLFHNGVALERIHTIVSQQVARGMVFCCEKKEDDVSAKAESIAIDFLKQLPEIKRLLLTDIQAIAQQDPAVDNYGEVVFSYPAIQVMLHHRTAHALHRLGVPIIPRIIAEQAHSLTGIDIHPAATIGEYFAIDHGTGIVIGGTAIIGNHVMLYQGVTLGAKNFQYDESGLPLDIPRHPIVEDNVTIYSNSSILGRIRIGHDSIIGGNIWITQDVPPHSRILQSKPQREHSFSDGAGI